MNKLMIRHTMDKPLPYDAEVEWLESTGTQYIALGLTMLGTDIVTVRCKNTDATIKYNPIFGREREIDNKYWAQYYVTDGNFYYYNTYLTAVWTTLKRNGQTYKFDMNWNVFRFYGVYCDINGVIYQQANIEHRTDSPDLDNPYLFGCHRTSASGDDILGSVRISSFKIERNGVTIMYLIPVRKGNTGYMYDKVSGRLFGNQGTGSFVVGPDYNPFAYQYLTFVPLEDSTFSFRKRGTGNDIEYSIDGGAWTALASGANTPTVGAGHNIRWRAELTPSTASDDQGIGTFSATGLYDAMGNTMSLLCGDNFVGQTTLVGTYTFGQLWLDDTHIYRADKVVLPATTLAYYCYRGMFDGCTSLTTAPELPATTLSGGCYQSMFNGCTSLTTAPALPATTLINSCYYYMFRGCTSLTTVPALPATTLADYCYYRMFYGCTILNYVKCLATDMTANSCTTDWLANTTSTGTFVKDANTTWPSGGSGIPAGWTVVDDPTINS